MNETQAVNFNEIPWLKIFNQTMDQPQALPAVLAGYGIDTYHLASVAQKSTDLSEAYGRKVLFQSHDVEVMVALWSYQAMAAPHNHGASKGMIWFVQGNFSEQQYRFQNRSLIQHEAPQFYQENQVVTVDFNDIHSCCPETVGLSLHIYCPPIHKMKVWDLANKRTLTVADNCGAWVPRNPNLILSETAW